MGMGRSGQTVDDPLCSSSFAHLLKSIGSSPMDLHASLEEEWDFGPQNETEGSPCLVQVDIISEDMSPFAFEDDSFWAELPPTLDDCWAQGGSPPPTNCGSSLAATLTASPSSSDLPSLPPSPEPMHPLQLPSAPPLPRPAPPLRPPSPPGSPLPASPEPARGPSPVFEPPVTRSRGAQEKKARRGKIDNGMRRSKGLNFMGIHDQKALAAFAEVTPRWGYLLAEPGFEAGWQQVLVRQFHHGSGMVEVYCPLLQGDSLTDRCRLLPMDRLPGLGSVDEPTGTKLRGRKRPREHHDPTPSGGGKRQRVAEGSIVGPPPQGVPASAQASQELPWMKRKAAGVPGPQEAPRALRVMVPPASAPHTAPPKGILGISLPPPRP